MSNQGCWSFAIGTLLLAASGCGGDERADSETTDSVQSELDMYACAVVSADASFLNELYPGHTSPQSYDKCDKSYVVDVEDLDEFYTGEGTAADAQINVKDVDAPIPNRWVCQATSITAAFYLWVGPGGGVTSTSTGGSETGWQLLSAGKTFGQWNSDTKRCSVSMAQEGTVSGGTYRIAAGVLASDGSTRKTLIRTLPPIGVRR